MVFGEAAVFLGFVLPGETAVIVAGVVAARGQVNIVVLCVIVVLAAIVGDSVGYAVGERYGRRLMDLRLLRSRATASSARWTVSRAAARRTCSSGVSPLSYAQ